MEQQKTSTTSSSRSPAGKSVNWRPFGPSPYIIAKPGDSLLSISHQIAGNSIRIRGHDEAKAILIHNNQISEVAPLRPGQVLNVSDIHLDDNQRTVWAADSARVSIGIRNLSPEILSLLQDEAPAIGPMASFGEQADDAGWISGEDLTTAGGFLVLGADSALAAGSTMLSQIQHLARRVVQDATAKFGKEVMLSRKAAQLEQVQWYLRTNPYYVQLQTKISELPRQLKSGLGVHLGPTPGVQAGDARWLRRIALVEEKGAARFFREAPALLENKIVTLGRFAKGTTFVLPAAIGIYNIAKASPLQQFKVAVDEAVGIGLGAYGTGVGLAIGEILVGALCLSGGGAFLLLFVVAGVTSYGFSEFGKNKVLPTLRGLFETGG